MPRYAQTVVDEVRSAADIVVVISDYVSLKKAGARYTGLCPFHGEKTASFSVDRDKGFFHCFGCGVGGDVFKFLELQEKVPFGEALRLLAGRFGVPLPQPTGGQGQENAAEREALLRMHEVASDHFREVLHSPQGARVRAYLRDERRLSADTVDTLRLGLASPHRDALRQLLLAKGFPERLLVQSGLISRREDGTEVDRFRNRLMVPIARETGTVIAFGGRALLPDQVPKYLNSPETAIYSKGKTLYGLHLTRSEVRRAGFAVLVEGYFDFAQLFQSGGVPVVATCGTALTPHQARGLRRFAAKAVLSYDADPAGEAAAARGAELLIEQGFTVVNVVRLPSGEDPDTFVQRNGRDVYAARLRDSQPYLDFLMDRAVVVHDLRREDGRREFVEQMLAVAARIPDAAARDHFGDRLAHRARVTEEVIRTEIRRAAVAKRPALPALAKRPAGASQPLRAAERGLLWGLVHEPDETLPLLATLEPDDLEGLRSEAILRQAVELSPKKGADTLGLLLGSLMPEDGQLVTSVASEAGRPVLRPDVCVHALKGLRLERARAEVQQQIDAWPADGSTAGLALLLERKLQLRRQLDQVRNAGIE